MTIVRMSTNFVWKRTNLRLPEMKKKKQKNLLTDKTPSLIS